MSTSNRYIVLCSTPVKASDNKYYSSVWGKITNLKSGIKVGFKNDFVVINEACVISRALCNVRPTPSEELKEYCDDDGDLDFIAEDLYICVEDKASNTEVISKLNKSKVKKRGNK
jgi:hypothetical protein